MASAKEAIRYLTARGVDFSDCFELNELRERFHKVKLLSNSRAAEKAKAKANAAFKRKSHVLAVRLYTEALGIACAVHDADVGVATRLVVLSLANRSMAYLNLGLAKRALADARRCVFLDPSYMKGLARVAAAYLALGQPESALEHLEAALELASSLDDKEHMEAQLDAARRAVAAREAHAATEVDTSDALTAGEAQEEATDAPSAWLQRIDEDLLVCVLVHLDCPKDLAKAAQSCRAFHRAASAHSSEGCWHSVCRRRFPEAASAAKAREETLRSEAGMCARAMLGQAETPAASIFAVDWQLLLRERELLATNWATGQATVSILGEHRGPSPGWSPTSPVYGCRMVGDTLLTASEDATLAVWDLAMRSSKPQEICEGHTNGVLGAWLSADGKKAISGGFDATIRIWDLALFHEPSPEAGHAEDRPPEVARGKCQRVFAGHSGPVASIECSTEVVFSTSFDGTLRFWDWSGKALNCICAHDGHASGLDLVGDGARCISGGDDGRVKEWDTATGALLSTLDGHEGAVWCVRHCPQGVAGGHLLSAATDGALLQWDLRSPHGPVHSQPGAHNDACAGLELLGDDTAVTAGFDSVVRVWDLRKGLAPRARFQMPTDTRCTRIAIDDHKIVMGSLTGRVMLIDVL